MSNATEQPGKPITGVQTMVLQMLADGYDRKVAARELNMSVGTLNDHVKHIFIRMAVHTIEAAVAAAMRRGLIK